MFPDLTNGIYPQSTYFYWRWNRVSVSAHSAGAYTATLRVMVNVMKGGWACPLPASPAWANFSLMMECTPESSHCYSVGLHLTTGLVVLPVVICSKAKGFMKECSGIAPCTFLHMHYFKVNRNNSSYTYNWTVFWWSMQWPNVLN